jgi:hypothetical protein
MPDASTQKSLMFVFRLEQECEDSYGAVYPVGYHVSTHIVYGYCPVTHTWKNAYGSFPIFPHKATLIEVYEDVRVTTHTKNILWNAS